MKYKILVYSLLILGLLNSVPTCGISNPIWRLFDSYFCSCFGKQNASEVNQRQVRMCLQMFGLQAPENIPIRSMSPEVVREHSCVCIVRPTGIWLNEEMFSLADGATPYQMYMSVRPAAQYACFSKKLDVLLGIKYLTDNLPSAFPLFDVAGNFYMFSQIYKRASQKNILTKKTILTDAILLSIFHWAPTLFHDLLNRFVMSFSKCMEKQVDKATAQMLCENGNVDLVRSIIEQLEHTIAQGGKISGNLHPSLEEIKDCLQGCVTEWEVKNQIVAE